MSQDEEKALEGRVATLEQYVRLVVALAIIFGLSGAWGATTLRDSWKEIEKMKSEFSNIEKTKKELDEFKNKKIAEIDAAAMEATTKALLSRTTVVKYGSRKRCQNDAWIFFCGHAPNQEWNWNTCYGRGHAKRYNATINWDGVGYKLASGPAAGSEIDLYCEN